MRFLVVSVIALGVVAGLVFGYGWGPASSVPEQHIGIQDDNSVPLSTRGKSISRWHGMNMPSYAYKPLATSCGCTSAQVKLSSGGEGKLLRSSGESLGQNSLRLE